MQRFKRHLIEIWGPYTRTTHLKDGSGFTTVQPLQTPINATLDGKWRGPYPGRTLRGDHAAALATFATDRPIMARYHMAGFAAIHLADISYMRQSAQWVPLP